MAIRSSSSSVDIIPKGHLAVYVGDQEKRRFVVPLSLLDQPSFQDLLRQSEEEFGYDHPMGGLTIPCREDVFIHVASGLVLKIRTSNFLNRSNKCSKMLILQFFCAKTATRLQSSTKFR
uniref:Uncharacterized protein n=1 Tax=Lactuca sativa TaxID=4236 RepID=A0A9R1XL78_LACSA|nr:hypothetical protein LSAT_V11C400183330 [Lactuca sativa]